MSGEAAGARLREAAPASGAPARHGDEASAERPGPTGCPTGCTIGAMPIFIVGFARSGTTLAQKLVSQHLAIPTLPETHYFEFLTAHEPAGGHLTSAGANALVEQLSGFLKIDAQALRQLLGRDEVPIRALFLQIIAQQIGSQASWPTRAVDREDARPRGVPRAHPPDVPEGTLHLRGAQPAACLRVAARAARARQGLGRGVEADRGVSARSGRST